MVTRAVSATLLVGLVLLAGCTGGLQGTASGPGSTAATAGGSTGTLALYVSDKPAAIGDFAHLNVTITRIGFHPANAGGSGNAPAAAKATDTPLVTATDTPMANTTGTPTANQTAANPSTPPANATVVEATDDGGNQSGDASGGWVTEAVDNRTVDLTTLVGDNATRIANVSLPAGAYDGVYVQVSAVTGTLTDGTTVQVKLPSGRLKLNKPFTLAPNASAGFVFDIAVHATGQGRYVLRPVIGQSGTDQPVKLVGTGHAGVNETAAASHGNTSRGSSGSNPGQGSGKGQGQGKAKAA